MESGENMSKEIVTYGQIAYQAYYDASDGRSLISGTPLPQWREQDERIRVAWNKAGARVCDAVIGDDLSPGERTAIRERLENLAAGMEASAAASAPGKKSEIETGCAQAVRGIAESIAREARA
jgi:hypothetical protein